MYNKWNFLHVCTLEMGDINCFGTLFHAQIQKQWIVPQRAK